MRKVDMPKVDINDPEDLQDLYTKLYPAGSGPLGVMRITCALIEAIAAEKGFELKVPGEDT